MYRIFIIYLLILIHLIWKLYGEETIVQYNNNTNTNKNIKFNSTIKKSRHKKALAFPYASTVGILVSIAVPIESPDRQIFFSYNFEANYNSPAASDFSSNRISQILEQGASQGNGQIPSFNNGRSNSNNKKHKHIKRNIPITRNFLYTSIEMNLIANGLNGKECLLKSICEAAELSFGEHNGVLGDLIHIILTPSSSKNDKYLSDEYYEAEYNGNFGNCNEYHRNCPENILDFISQTQILS